MCIFPSVVRPDSGNPMGVVYPEMREPYRSIFSAIRSGVKKSVRNSVREFEITKGQGPPELNSWISQNEIKTMVSLGKKGLEACAQLPKDMRMVVGAVLAPLQEDDCALYGGIALAPAPDRLFEKLKQLAPNVATVIVVYNAELNNWLIDYARPAAQKWGLVLQTIESEDLLESAQIYQDLIEKGIGNTTAIWLPQDPFTVDQKTVLPILLKESWRANFVVFSSNPAHVNRGVLFALYPDYRAMGERLGKLAVEASQAAGNKKTPIQPLQDVLIAVNLRTADHLKLNLTKKQRKSFDLTFPASR